MLSKWKSYGRERNFKNWKKRKKKKQYKLELTLIQLSFLICLEALISLGRLCVFRQVNKLINQTTTKRNIENR